MKYLIKHRVNRIDELLKVEPRFGAEIDIRSDVSRPRAMHLSHDAWAKGDDFDQWLGEFKRLGFRGPLILNTKEDGLEQAILEKLARHAIENYFFLDTAIPTLIKWVGQGHSRFALRLSQYESKSFCEQFIGKVDWIWADCFGGKPLRSSELEPLAPHFKICLVAPELQGKSAEELPAFRELFPHAYALCTKVPELAAKEFLK